RMCHEHEHFYGDTSALNLPTRAHAYRRILDDPIVRSKLIHGSDWPIIAIPPVMRLGCRASIATLGMTNWMNRDVEIKRQLGFDQAYWTRGARVLRIA
ncbi:MAG: hypothetical protein ACREJC_17565, partial [Tepidisphaeraceae bacterium]